MVSGHQLFCTSLHLFLFFTLTPPSQHLLHQQQYPSLLDASLEIVPQTTTDSSISSSEFFGNRCYEESNLDLLLNSLRDVSLSSTTSRQWEDATVKAQAQFQSPELQQGQPQTTTDSSISCIEFFGDRCYEKESDLDTFLNSLCDVSLFSTTSRQWRPGPRFSRLSCSRARKPYMTCIISLSFFRPLPIVQLLPWLLCRCLILPPLPRLSLALKPGVYTMTFMYVESFAALSCTDALRYDSVS
jgi:hypothetical protein